MAKAYRMTSRRRAALRKAQLASAAKRRGRGRGRVKSHLRKHGKKYVAGVAVAAAVAGGTSATKSHNRKIKRSVNRRNAKYTSQSKPQGKTVRVYHHTSAANARSIKKSGFKGSKGHDSRVYFSDKPMRGHRYGRHVVTTTVKRKKLQRDALKNYRTGANYFSVHEKDLKGSKISTHKTTKKRAKVSSNPYTRSQKRYKKRKR